MVTGLKKIDGHYYYFESNIKNGKETAGYMVTYWHEIKGKRYYFGRNVVMVTSKVIDWNWKKYYVEKNDYLFWKLDAI
jgi:glucan-binding YG repeat protein